MANLENKLVWPCVYVTWLLHCFRYLRAFFEGTVEACYGVYVECCHEFDCLCSGDAWFCTACLQSPVARAAAAIHIHDEAAYGAAFDVVAAFERNSSHSWCLSGILLLVSVSSDACLECLSSAPFLHCAGCCHSFKLLFFSPVSSTSMISGLSSFSKG